MKKTIRMVLIGLLLMLAVACQGEGDGGNLTEDKTVGQKEEALVSEDKQEERPPVADGKTAEEVTEAPAQEEKPLPAGDQEALRNEFLDYVRTAPGLVNVRKYVTENISKAEPALADDMLYELMAHGKFDAFDEMDSLFLEENAGIHPYLMDIYNNHYQDLEGTGMILGSKDKGVILSLIEDEAYRLMVEALFDQGYGLVMAEGAFYPETDYLLMQETYGSYISPMMTDFLAVLGDSQMHPTTIEEYLAISPDELKERAVAAESFLMDYPEMPKQFRQDVGNVLLNCIWKLSGPNIFDGMLTEDFILSPEVAQMYQEILDEAPTPIVTAAAKGLTDWVSAKKGEPLGTYDDMSQMYEAYNDIFKNALTLMDELYPMN